MTEENFIYILNILPDTLRKLLIFIPREELSNINELRLRVNKTPTVTCFGKNLFITEKGLVRENTNNSPVVSVADLQKIFLKLCDNSIYSHEEEIKNGYITVKYGIRVGVAGAAVYENKKIISINKINSLNIRFPTEIIGVGEDYKDYLSEGLLIAGPPASGKTTIIRDIARILSNGVNGISARVCVVDCRNEIAAAVDGVSPYDLGPLTDVISGMNKRKAFEIAVRTLTPEYIVVDEIGDIKDAESIRSSFFCGVKFIMTSHAESVDLLLKRDVIEYLVKTGVINTIAFLPYVKSKPIFLRFGGDGTCLNLQE